MDLKNNLWYELSLVDFSNLELLLLHGYICLALRHPSTFKLSSVETMQSLLERIQTHLKGIELLSDQDISFIKTQEEIYG